MIWWNAIRLWSKDYDVRWEAAKKLGASKSRRAVKPLLAALWSQDNTLRILAARALGEIGDTRAVEPLIKVLQKYADNSFSREAASALGKIGDVRAIQPLVEALWKRDTEVRKAAEQALVIFGPAAVKQLQIALRDKESFGSTTVAEILGQIGDPRAVESLIEAIQNKESKYLREKAAEALGNIKDNRAEQPLVEALEDKEVAVRVEAARALGKIGDARAVKLLIEALNDSDEHVRGRAAEALGKIKAASSVAPLQKALKDGKAFVRRMATEAIGEIRDPSAMQPLVETLEDLESSVRMAAGQALQRMGWQPTDDEQRASLAVALQDWREVVSLGVVAVSPLVRVALRHQEAVEALGEIGDVRAVGPLIQYAMNEYHTLQYSHSNSDADSALCTVVYSLTKLLERAAGQISTEHLRVLSKIQTELVDAGWKIVRGVRMDPGHGGRTPTAYYTDYYGADPTEVNRLAKNELKRRGVSV